MQDREILPVRPRRLRFVQQVVGGAETAGREQLLAVAVVGQGAGLADQRVDHVPVIDPLFLPPAQPRQRLHQLLPVPHFQVLHVDAHLDTDADQATVHRVGVVLHVDGAAACHRYTQTLARFQTPRRQRSQQRLLLGQPRRPSRVALPAYLVQERRVRFPIGKVPAAAQHQRLRHRIFEVPMRGLRIAVLVRLSRLNLLPRQSVMSQQRLVPPAEVAPLRQVVHGAAHAVATMPLRYTTQFPQCVLQADAQALETLRKADRHRLPVRVRQHEVVHQVIERLARERHVQASHVREVRGAQPAGRMHLAEVHFLSRSER